MYPQFRVHHRPARDVSHRLAFRSDTKRSRQFWSTTVTTEPATAPTTDATSVEVIMLQHFRAPMRRSTGSGAWPPRACHIPPSRTGGHCGLRPLVSVVSPDGADRDFVPVGARVILEAGLGVISMEWNLAAAESIIDSRRSFYGFNR
jgi:hypothetical protein